MPFFITMYPSGFFFCFFFFRYEYIPSDKLMFDFKKSNWKKNRQNTRNVTYFVRRVRSRNQHRTIRKKNLLILFRVPCFLIFVARLFRIQSHCFSQKWQRHSVAAAAVLPSFRNYFFMCMRDFLPGRRSFTSFLFKLDFLANMFCNND